VLDSISTNPIFQGNQEIFDYLVNDVQILLYMPEDNIITQGQEALSLFFLARGNCTVWVKDHMKRSIQVNDLEQGEMFGEIALLTDQHRTATVKSSNYCTLASMKKKTFFEMCQNFPDLIVKMKEKSLEYQDPWKQFKMKLLSQVDYFKDIS
jgi:CRP-like cAMP-binding protein